MSEFRDQLLRLLGNRHAPEARAFYGWLIRVVGGRVTAVGRRFTPDLLQPAELEEITGEVMLQLVGTSLARFRGETEAEMLAFVRVISDRAVCRRVRRRLAERRAIEGGEPKAWMGRVDGPEDIARSVPECPLGEADQTYLRELIESGSKVNLARAHGVSRAAVTQRVQRIQSRIAALAPRERAAVEAWLEQTAREVLEAGTPR